MLRRRRSVAPRTNACVKENAHPENDRTTADDTNFRKVNTMKMLPYQEVKSGLETALLPPRSAVTPVKLNPPMKSSELWSPTMEYDRPSGIQMNTKYNTQLRESLEGSPKKQILPHANPDRSSQHVEGPVAALKLMFDSVVTAIKHAFSKEDSNTIHGQDPDDINKGIRNDSHNIRVPRSKRKRSNLRGLPSPEPKRKQSLEVIGPHQAPFTNRIFPGSSMVSPSSLMGMEVGSPLSCGTANSPTLRKIRNPLLRSYYCLSPVAKRVDFSSLRIDTSSNSLSEESSENNRNDGSLSFTEVKSPAPPPSVPPPAPPPPPPPPPPIPSLSGKLAKCTTQVPMMSSSNVQEAQGGSKLILRDMQQRLRSRMRGQMHTGPERISEKGNQSNRADLMYLQWIEIQAHKMKMKPQEIKILAEKKQAELCDLLKSLKTMAFTTLEEVSIFIESYQEGLTWFPGGTKELKSMTNDDMNYASLESRIDVMTEYVHIMSDMSAVMAECRSAQKGICMASPTVRIQRILDEYKQRDRLWGPVILSQGRLWKENNLPFEPQSIEDGANHLLQLALQLALCVSAESENIRGLLVSFGCTRTNKVKSFLHQTLEVLLECTKYIHCPESSVSLSLQESASILVSSHLRISCDQYEGFLYRAGQQIVCAHFEETLKILSRMKEIVRKIYGLGHLSNGYIDYLPASENLVAQINRSCNLLLKHVQTAINQTLSALDEVDMQKSTHSYKEMICWMIFSCKYAERNLEILGNKEEEKMSGLQELLEGLQTLETMLGGT